MRNISIESAILSLKSSKEVRDFLVDICTPTEIKAIEERWNVAQLLFSKKYSYREIAGKLKVSTATVTRVARFLFTEEVGGYKKILKRLLNE